MIKELIYLLKMFDKVKSKRYTSIVKRRYTYNVKTMTRPT